MQHADPVDDPDSADDTINRILLLGVILLISWLLPLKPVPILSELTLVVAIYLGRVWIIGATAAWREFFARADEKSFGLTIVYLLAWFLTIGGIVLVFGGTYKLLTAFF